MSYRIAGTFAAMLLVLVVSGCTKDQNHFPGDAASDGDGVDVTPSAMDQDGDGISDADEGRYLTEGPADTDGDGVPDCLDTDSDADGIPDMVEAGDFDAATPPVDTDADGDPDFRDLDSDGNGILDADEGANDSDLDGVPDFRDDDNDGDTIPDVQEIGGNPDYPVDWDADGVPDYMDLDSDGDSITDLQEKPANQDSDGDLMVDMHDLDTDGDGLSDAEEAGDTNPGSWPRDTDEDGTADFRDLDSDNDGLSDQWEDENGLDPYNEDTDLDGIPDLIEVGAGTDPMDASSNPTADGNFYFLVPYDEDPDPGMDTLVFATDIQKADVFFMMDTTGSMSGATANLKSGLTGTIIPGIDAIIPDAWYGVSNFDDYPYGSYGSSSSGDVVFQLHQRMTGDPAIAQTAVNGLPTTHIGGDGPESDVPALWATATGDSLGASYLAAQTSCAAGEVGYPCFRDGAVPILVLITDSPFHNGPDGSNMYSGVVPTPPTYAEALVELLDIHARVIGVHTGSDTTAKSHLVQVATDTGAIDISGNPLVYDVSWDGTGLSTEVVGGIETLASDVPIDVSARDRDDDTDLVDATIFIDRVVPNAVGGVSDPADPAMICVGGLTVADTSTPPDGQPDEFLDVLPGTIVCFDIFPARNMTIEPTDEPQVFKAYVDVIGEGITVLDTREIFFMIPPHIEGPGVPD